MILLLAITKTIHHPPLQSASIISLFGLDLLDLSHLFPISTLNYITFRETSPLWNSTPTCPFQTASKMAQDENAPFDDPSSGPMPIRKAVTPLATKLLNQSTVKVRGLGRPSIRLERPNISHYPAGQTGSSRGQPCRSTYGETLRDLRPRFRPERLLRGPYFWTPVILQFHARYPSH